MYIAVDCWKCYYNLCNVYVFFQSNNQKGGESVADIEQLYRDHYGFIYKFLISLCRNESVAEELTQETFFRAYINIKRLRMDNKAVVWLCQIARNLYYAWYNEQKKLLPLEDQAVHCAVSDMAETVKIKALSAQAMDCLLRLEAPYREVFELYVFGEMSLKEISQLYGKSESWARVTFYRAKQKIAERMN